MASERVLQWCTNTGSVTAELAHATANGGSAEDAFKVAERLFARRKRDRLLSLNSNFFNRNRSTSNASSTTASQPTSPPWSGGGSVGTSHSRQGSAVSTPDTSSHSTFVSPMSPEGRGSLKLLNTISKADQQQQQQQQQLSTPVAPPTPPAATVPDSIAPTKNTPASVSAAASNPAGSPTIPDSNSQNNGLSQHRYASMSSISFTSESSSIVARRQSASSSVGSQQRRLSTASLRSAKSFRKSLEHPITPADLDRAAACGKFRERPSDLFLKVSVV